MKKLFPMLLGLFLMVSLTVRSQSSKEYCEEVTNSATKLVRKVKKKHILNASKNYSLALKAIEKAKTDYPNEEFGYDKLAAEIPSWLRMYQALAKLDGNKIVDKKGNTFEFVIVDYKPLKEEAKRISEKEWTNGKKADDLTGHTSGIKFFKYTGKVKTAKEWTSYSMNYTINIVDARIPNAPVKVGSVVINKTVSDSRKTQSYTGDSQAKPFLVNDTHRLSTEAEFKAQIEKEKTDIVSLLNHETGITPKYMEVVKLLNENIGYVKVR